MSAERGTWLDALRERLPGRVSVDADDLEHHSHDEAYPEHRRPGCVVFAGDRDDVVATLEVARDFGVAVTPFTVGSSLEGSVLAVQGAISLDLSRMDAVLALEPESLSVTAGPGLRIRDLNAALEPHGLFFSIDLGSNASLGGMSGTNASGSNALRYGDMRQQVLAMEVVLADGRTIRVGSRARKGSSGYDLKDLLVGSEGTLGVVTELTVRVHALPRRRESLRATFPTVGAAVGGAVALARAGLGLARGELIDEPMLRAVNAYASADHPELPTLWLELHGSSEAGVAAEIDLARALLDEAGAQGTTAASGREEQADLWEARNHAWYAAGASAVGERTFVTDVCVPLGRLTEAIDHTHALLAEHGVDGPILGHVGDGNYHVFFRVPPDDDDRARRVDAVVSAMTARALELGGTCTGEHGVGLRKLRYQAAEHGEALEVMRAVKKALDPAGILNPGKVLPEGATRAV